MNEEKLSYSAKLHDITQKQRIRQKCFSHSSLKTDLLKPSNDDAMHLSSLLASKSDALKDESAGDEQDGDVDHNCYIRDPGNKRKHIYATENMARGIADSVPEVHFIGEILEGISFDFNHSSSISCKFTIEWGKYWSFLEGEYNGQTQFTCTNEGNRSVWNHPIDIHLASANVKSWPRILIQIYSLDKYGDDVISGYGFTHLPTTVGRHDINIPCWRPKASKNGRKQKNHFSGILFDQESMSLSDELHTVMHSRHKLTTIPSGQVYLQLYLSQRFF